MTSLTITFEPGPLLPEASIKRFFDTGSTLQVKPSKAEPPLINRTLFSISPAIPSSPLTDSEPKSISLGGEESSMLIANFWLPAMGSVRDSASSPLVRVPWSGTPLVRVPWSGIPLGKSSRHRVFLWSDSRNCVSLFSTIYSTKLQLAGCIISQTPEHTHTGLLTLFT